MSVSQGRGESLRVLTGGIVRPRGLKKRHQLSEGSEQGISCPKAARKAEWTASLYRNHSLHEAEKNARTKLTAHNIWSVAARQSCSGSSFERAVALAVSTVADGVFASRVTQGVGLWPVFCSQRWIWWESPRTAFVISWVLCMLLAHSHTFATFCLPPPRCRELFNSNARAAPSVSNDRQRVLQPENSASFAKSLADRHAQVVFDGGAPGAGATTSPTSHSQ